MCSPMPDGLDFPDTPDSWIELAEAEQEMTRQDGLWGPQQDHQDTGGDPELLDGRLVLYAGRLRFWRRVKAANRSTGELGWDNLLFEEVYEAASESDDEKRRVELIQVAALALQWAGAIRRRQKDS